MELARLKPKSPGVILVRLLVCLIGLALLWQRGISLGFHERLPPSSFSRPLMNMAIAISHMRYGAPAYFIFRPVTDAMVANGLNSTDVTQPGATNRAITSALNLNFVADCQVVGCSFNEDDKGYSDFIVAAFYLFGFNLSALYHFFFVVFATSFAMFLAQFARCGIGMTILLAYLASVAMAFELLSNSAISSVPSDSRFFPVLSGLSSLHLAILALGRTRLTWSAVLLALGQMAIIAFVVFARSAALWQIIFLTTWITLVIAARVLIGSFRARESILRACVIFSIVIGFSATQQIVSRLLQSNAASMRSTTQHPFWHPIAMGFAFHPDAFDKYGFGTRDWDIYNVTYAYLSKNPKVAADLGIDLKQVQFEGTDHYPNFNGVGWDRYDLAVKSLLEEFVSTNPRIVFETVFWYRPLYAFQQVFWQTGLLRTFPQWIVIDPVHLPVGYSRMNPLTLPAAIFLAGAIFVGCSSLRNRQALELSGLGAMFFLSSMLPMLLVLPLYQEMGVVTVALGTALILAVVALVSTVRRKLF
jgi:hypothetical protein